MSTFGDKVESAGGEMDWGDGKTDRLDSCCSWDLTHKYLQAKGYHASATFGEQHNNANNPPGGCSYVCRLQQAAKVTIFLKSGPQCKNGIVDRAKR